MRIELEMGNALTLGALRDFVGQVERSGGSASAYVTFSKRRGDGVVVACADFEPMGRPGDLAAPAASELALRNREALPASDG